MFAALCNHTAEEPFNASCWRGLIKCPLMNHCDKLLEIGEIESHCRLHHQELIFDDIFNYTMIFGRTNIVILMKQGKPYAIYCYVYKNDLRFKVLCLNPCFTSDNDLWNIKLFTNSSGELIFNQNFPMVPFNKKVHCPRCAFGSMRYKCHDGPSQAWRIAQLDAVNESAVRILSTEKHFQCKIECFSSEMMHRRSTYNDELIKKILECHVCKKFMGSKILNCENGHSFCELCTIHFEDYCFCQAPFLNGGRNYLLEHLADFYKTRYSEEFQVDKEVKEILECQICTELMCSEIFNCLAGHSICGSCMEKLKGKECGLCKRVYEGSRNILLEKLGRCYLVACKNSGCSFVDNLDDIEVHEEHCNPQ